MKISIKLEQGRIFYKPNLATDIDDVSEEVIALADIFNQAIQFEFNDKKLIASKDSTPSSIRNVYFGILNNDEGKLNP